jgi:MFS transporter, YNFM family, putative membrane transport protein
MLGAAALSLAAAAAPSWTALLVFRAVLGVVLGGVPAVAMAYLAEEIDAKGLGAAMGLYVGGTAFGGMVGRMGTGILADHFGWRLAVCIISASGIVAAAAFALLVPPSRRFVRRPGFEPAYHLRAWASHLLRRDMVLLFACGFLVMGAFVTIYNYAGFRLMRPPYSLDQTALGFVFGVYVFGIATSWLAGSMAAKLGRRLTLRLGFVVTGCGVLMTRATDLSLVILGIVVLTIGFFMTHSTASGWVGRLAVGTKGHASSLYLLAYYLGSSVAGSVGGYYWSTDGWDGVVEFTLALVAVGFVAAFCVRPDRADSPASLPDARPVTSTGAKSTNSVRAESERSMAR